MAWRRCLVCKRLGSQDELIRLYAHGSKLRVTRSPDNQRSVWLCHRSECLNRMTSQPGRASPGLKQRIRSGPDWHAISLAARWSSVQTSLKFCMRSGLIDLLSNQDGSTIKEKWIALLWSQSAIKSSKPLSQPLEKPFEVFHLPVSEEALGAAIGRPPSAGLLIQPGKPSQRLLRHLHRFVQTG